jgi:ParB-like chromosome segregation protein Spo0J
MELRRVDPRIIKANPGNPRKIQPGDMSDATLAASIQAVGILQPPAVTEKNGELTLKRDDIRRNRRAIPESGLF